jgi:hypothetical protein
LSTGASLPAYTDTELNDNNPATVSAVSVDLFMTTLLKKSLT